MTRIVYIQMHMEDCRVEARVNDIAVLRKNASNIVTMARPIHEYLLNGENALSLKVNPLKDEFSTSSKVHVRVAAFQEGDFLEFDSGQNLAEIKFAKKEDQVTRTQQKASFHLSWPHQWSWSTAPTLTIDASLRQYLDQFLTYIYNEFSNQQPDRLMQLQRPHYQDLEKCYPTGGLHLRESEFKKYITNQDSIWDVMPLNLEGVNYRLAANGRLVECVDSHNLPIIRTQVEDVNAPNQTDGYVALPMHIGLLDGTLRILR